MRGGCWSAPLVLLAVLGLRPGLGAQNVLTIQDRTPPAGSQFSTLVTLTHEDNLAGVQVAFRFDGDVIQFLDGTTAGLDVETLLAPDGIELLLIVENPVGSPFSWVAFGIVFDHEPPFRQQVVPPGTEQSMLEVHFTSDAGAAGASTDLDLIQGLGNPPIDNILVVGGFSIEPELVDGTVTLGDPLPGVPFLRGDADGNGVLNGLIDGLFGLNFQFVPGSPSPVCLDAADADDNGIFNGLNDSLLVLNFFFVPGSPPPAPPVGFCGLDPTPDALPCGMPACP